MPKPWEQHDLIKRLLEIQKSHGNLTSREYDKLEVPDKPTRVTIRKSGLMWSDYFGNIPKTEHEDIAGEMPQENTSDQVLIVQRQYDKLLKAFMHQKNLNAIFLDNCLPIISKCSFRASPVPPPEKIPRQQEFHAMKSDDQVGQLIDPAWVQGVAEYNVELYKKRMDIWLEKMIMFREQDKASLGLNKLVIYMLGDHVEGELIFKGQAYFIDMVLVDQLMTCLQVYVNTILRLAAEFPVIEVFCVQGNHGRHGGKGEASPKSNFDYLLFRLMKQSLAHQENVSIFISESPTMLIRNGDYNFSLNHNDDVKGYMGIPYYGLDRKARRLDSLYGMKIHYKLGGHFHVPSNLGDETLMNGTMVGGSDLSVNKMQMASVPSQKIFYFDPRHGIHRETNIRLAAQVKLEPDEHGIYTSYT